MATVPKNVQQPIFSGGQVVWLAIFLPIAGVCALAFHSTATMIGFGVSGIVGALPHFNGEGAIYRVVGRAIWFKWKHMRLGTVYRREFSSTAAVLHKGVGRAKKFFKVEFVLLGVNLDEKSNVPSRAALQVPAMIKGRTHTIYLISRSNPSAAMADSDDRLRLEYGQAGVYADVAAELGAGNSFAIWSLHRQPDSARDRIYWEERLDPSLTNPEDGEAVAKLEAHAADYEEITAGDWERTYGLALSATNPRSWRGSKLDKLPQKEFMASQAVRASLVAEEKMSSISLQTHVAPYEVFTQFLREVMHLHEQELPRDRALADKVEQSIASSEGRLIDPRDTFTHDDSPLPRMQIEVANNYFIFDGTYHRVLWIEDYLNDESFDALHTAQCDYFVSIYVDVNDLERDDSLRQDRARLIGQLKVMLKRNVTAQDTAELEEIDADRYRALEFGQKVPWFRTLIVVSGRNFVEMEDNQNILRDHLARTNIRVKIRTVTGPDQLEWFFALGTYGTF